MGLQGSVSETTKIIRLKTGVALTWVAVISTGMASLGARDLLNPSFSVLIRLNPSQFVSLCRGSLLHRLGFVSISAFPSVLWPPTLGPSPYTNEHQQKNSTCEARRRAGKGCLRGSWARVKLEFGIRPLSPGHPTPGFLIHGFLIVRKMSMFGVWAAPAAPTTIPGMVFGAARAAQTPKCQWAAKVNIQERGSRPQSDCISFACIRGWR